MSACTGACADCPFACHADHENDPDLTADEYRFQQWLCSLKASPGIGMQDWVKRAIR